MEFLIFLSFFCNKQGKKKFIKTCTDVCFSINSSYLLFHDVTPSGKRQFNFQVQFNTSSNINVVASETSIQEGPWLDVQLNSKTGPPKKTCSTSSNQANKKSRIQCITYWVSSMSLSFELEVCIYIYTYVFKTWDCHKVQPNHYSHHSLPFLSLAMRRNPLAKGQIQQEREITQDKGSSKLSKSRYRYRKGGTNHISSSRTGPTIAPVHS